jgi:hypothetical protein
VSEGVDYSNAISRKIQKLQENGVTLDNIHSKMELSAIEGFRLEVGTTELGSGLAKGSSPRGEH